MPDLAAAILSVAMIRPLGERVREAISLIRGARGYYTGLSQLNPVLCSGTRTGLEEEDADPPGGSRRA